MVREDDTLHLPPACKLGTKRIGASSLKDEAEAMRIRLAKMNIKTTSHSERSTEKYGPHETAKYSLEILTKKVKKVEKLMADKSPGTKEYQKLEKKLNDYRTQIRRQKGEDDDKTFDKRTYASTEVPTDACPEEPTVLRNNSIHISDHTLRMEDEEGSRAKDGAEKGRAESSHSFELLTRKLKKVEKMLQKSTRGSKEYKKLTKKQKEYTELLQDIPDENYDTERDVVKKGKKGAYDLERNQETHGEDHISLQCETNISHRKVRDENGKEDEERSQAPQTNSNEEGDDEDFGHRKGSSHRMLDQAKKPVDFYNLYTRYGEDDQERKQAFLEEARKIKKEAMEKKRIEELNRKKKEADEEKRLAVLEEAGRMIEEEMEKGDLNKKMQEEEYEYKSKNHVPVEEDRRTTEESSEEQRNEESSRSQEMLGEEPIAKNDVDREEQTQHEELPIATDYKKGDRDFEEKEHLSYQPRCDESTREAFTEEPDSAELSAVEEGKEDVSNKDVDLHGESRISGTKTSRVDQKASSEAKEVNESSKKSSLGFLSEIRSRSKNETEIEYQEPKILHDSSLKKSKSNFLAEIQSKGRNLDSVKCSPSDADKGAPLKRPNFLKEISQKVGHREKDEIECPNECSTPHRTPQLVQEIQEIDKGKEEQNTTPSLASCDSTGSNLPSNPVSINSNFVQTIPSMQESTSTIPSCSTQKSDMRSDGSIDTSAIPEPYSGNTKKLLRELEAVEIRRTKLEKSLIQNGIPITTNISYEEAKDKISEITESMKALTMAEMDSYTMEKKYFYLEQELSRYTSALMLTDEYAEEHKRLENEWESSIESDNVIAIEKLRSHMPVKVRHMTEEQLTTSETPNGKILPKAFARKFKRTNILQLLRVDPDDIEMMHPSLLEGMRTTGLTLTERRALHHHFKEVSERWIERKSDPSIEKKCQWYQGLRSKFKEMLTAYLKCIEQHGPPGSHQYVKRNDPSSGGCKLIGNQCPLKADATMDYSEDYGYTKEAIYENSGGQCKSQKKSQTVSSSLPKPNTVVTKPSEEDIQEQYRRRLRLDPHETEVDMKLLREVCHSYKRIKSLEKQLTLAGLSLPQEDISYGVAKSKVFELTNELKKTAVAIESTSDHKEKVNQEKLFQDLSQELDKYTNALMLTKEWAEEQREKERKWENDMSAANCKALEKIRRHMPVDIRSMSENTLATALTPNGKVLPMDIAKKFKRTNILMILRTDPTVIEQMHPSSLEAMRTTGLTLTERRAIHEHLKEVAPKWKAMVSDKMCERKWMWHASLDAKFKEMLSKYEKHIEKYGPPGNHPYRKRNDPDAGGCPLIGIQCPIKADLAIDYSIDYGFPDGPVYEQQAVAKSNLISMEELEKRRREEDNIY